MKKRIIILCLLSLVMITSGCGGSGDSGLYTIPEIGKSASGKVINIFSGEPIIGAVVKSNNSTTSTDSNGQFLLEDIGISSVQITHPEIISENFPVSGYISEIICQTIPADFNLVWLKALCEFRDSGRTAIMTRPPHFLVYSKDTLGNEVDEILLGYIIDCIQKLPTVHLFFQSSYEIVDDAVPAAKNPVIYTSDQNTIIQIIVKPDLYVRGLAETEFNDYIVENGRILLREDASIRTIFHEMGHIFFGSEDHPDGIVPTSQWDKYLEYSVMNDLTSKPSAEFSEMDKKILKIIYSRPPGWLLP